MFVTNNIRNAVYQTLRYNIITPYTLEILSGNQNMEEHYDPYIYIQQFDSITDLYKGECKGSTNSFVIETRQEFVNTSTWGYVDDLANQLDDTLVSMFKDLDVNGVIYKTINLRIVGSQELSESLTNGNILLRRILRYEMSI